MKFIEENNIPKPVSYYFAHSSLSKKMGMNKPNVDIFESVLQKISIPAVRCLFLDDSKANCDAAKKLGVNYINVPVRTDFRDMEETI